jgi:phage repressor protein C with HTH and peptisase S24 domain
MPGLNTMFNKVVNTVCNTSCLVQPIISVMHKQMERLYQAAKELRNITTPTELARALNQSQQTVNNWESRGISKSGLIKAQAMIGCSATWLETGEGAMTIGPAMGAAEEGVPYGSPFIEAGGGLVGARPVREGEDPDTVAIPRVKLRLRAGVAEYGTEPDLNGDGFERIPRSVIGMLGLDPSNLLAMRVRGISMEPMLFEDEVVIIDTSDKRPISREVYALNFNGEPCIKQLILRGSEWFLHSLHSEYGPVNVKSGQCSIVGRLVIQPTRVLTGKL